MHMLQDRVAVVTGLSDSLIGVRNAPLLLSINENACHVFDTEGEALPRPVELLS